MWQHKKKERNEAKFFYRRQGPAKELILQRTGANQLHLVGELAVFTSAKIVKELYRARANKNKVSHPLNQNQEVKYDIQYNEKKKTL